MSTVGKIARELLASDPERLVQLVEQQAERIAVQDGQIARLNEQLLALEQRLEAVMRQSMRGAAPFAVPESRRKKQRKSPGRKPGHDGSFRERLDDTEIDQIIDVPLSHCPICGLALDAALTRPIEQTIIEVPPLAPLRLRLKTYRNCCGHCEQPVSSTHPLQVSHATGAAGTHLGPRALAIAGWLNKGLGMSMRKTCQVLAELIGIKLSPGGLSQAMARLADRLQADYCALLDRIKACPALYTDETSWWVDGSGHSLWVLTNDAGTYYRVVPSRSQAQAVELIGGYQGVLVSDCLNIYDDLTETQHKCYAHHLKVIAKALENPAAKDSTFLKKIKALLQAAITLKSLKNELPPEKWQQIRTTLGENAQRYLSERPPDFEHMARWQIEEKVRVRLAKQQDHLFTFLDHDDVDATNNRAERQLRPAVINRKTSCGNKTENGARTWETLASLAATCQQTGRSFIELAAQKAVLKPAEAER